MIDQLNMFLRSVSGSDIGWMSYSFTRMSSTAGDRNAGRDGVIEFSKNRFVLRTQRRPSHSDMNSSRKPSM